MSKMHDDQEVDRITCRLKDKVYLITGATGLVGKVLLEKLLRMTEIGKIYLLIRKRKGKTPRQRMIEMLDNPLFDLLKKSMTVETILSKIKVIDGDVAVIGLGLSAEDRQDIIENVEIICHSAATVKFDEKLKKAIELNVRGAYEMAKLGLECKKLIEYQHLSTTYCHVNVKCLEEKRYEPPADPYKMIKLVDLLTEQQLDAIQDKLLDYMPNTYSFTKCLGEAVVFDAIDKGLPGIVFRPSIVTPILLDPLPGWNDNQNGPSGLMIAAGRGIMRTSWIDQKSFGDFIPADLVANSLIVSNWAYNTVRPRKNVFNLTSSKEIEIRWEDIIRMGLDLVHESCFNFLLWYPSGHVTRHYWLYKFYALLFHWIPAYILDELVALFGYKKFFVRAHTKLAKGNEVLAYYANNNWDFDKTNPNIVRAQMTRLEKEKYKVDASNVDVKKYFEDCFLGARRYLLKEKDETLPRSRKLIKIMYILDRLVKGMFYFMVIYLLWKYLISSFMPQSSMENLSSVFVKILGPEVLNVSKSRVST